MFTIKLIRQRERFQESTVYSCRSYTQRILAEDESSLAEDESGAEYILKGLNGSTEDVSVKISRTLQVADIHYDPYDKIFIMNEQGKTIDSFVAQ